MASRTRTWASAAARRLAGGDPNASAVKSLYPAGHYYSPIPSQLEVRARADELWPDPAPQALPGIDLDERGQLDLLTQLAAYYPEQPFADEPRDGLRYSFDNIFYSYADALYLYALLRHLRPRRVIEVGSGHSSAVTLDTNERFLANGIRCTFIEPDPARLNALLTPVDHARTEIITRPVQQVPVARFTELEANDILFIDGSHVAKIGSDVNYLIFEVLPRLRPGVYIHLHDIFYPFEYPRVWVEEGRAWNEAYLVRAYLQHNQSVQIALFGDYLARCHRARLAELMPLTLKNTGGSLWLRRV
jgi:predicted O-methyltransferase YrrM